jgi:DNA-binding winged helix-turn-helix (wHTH) protein
VIYDFDDCSLDTERRELRRGDDLVSVEPQVFDLLLLLIRNRTRVVSKDDLIEHVWHGRIISDSALYSKITAARQAIADTGEAQRLIRTTATPDRARLRSSRCKPRRGQAFWSCRTVRRSQSSPSPT